MRSSGLGNHATRLETSHVIFASFELVTRTPPVLGPLRGDPEEPAHTPFTETVTLDLASTASKRRSCYPARRVLLRLSSSPDFRLKRGHREGWQRHVESTCATRIFGFQRRTPTSCVATEPPSAFAPCDSMNRSCSGERSASGEQAPVGFRGHALFEHSRRCLLTR
jgi:hypothetical protein